MNKKEAAALNAAKAEISITWLKACVAEGVPSDSKFVVFSPDNPHMAEHNRLMLEFMKLRKRIAHNEGRRMRHATLTGLGLTRVKGALGGVYYE